MSMLLVSRQDAAGRRLDLVAADGSYERDGQRLLWAGDPAHVVLRMPSQDVVSVRELRPPTHEHALDQGLRRLAAALLHARAEDGQAVVSKPSSASLGNSSECGMTRTV